jgi:hypothetical protein
MKRFGISLMIIFALALLALTLVGFTSVDVPQWTTIEFQPNTTIDQAWQALQGYDLVTLSSFYWEYPVNTIYSVGSSSSFDPKNPQAVCDEYWRKVLQWVDLIVRDTRTGAAANGNTPFFVGEVKKAEAKLAELTPLQGCWDRHDCPSFTVDRIEVVVPGDSVSDRIEREQTVVNQVQRFNDYPTVKLRSLFLALWVLFNQRQSL